MKAFIAFAVLVASLAPLRASAQETDTEKTAAGDVMKKMADLEQSLDVPGLVAKLTGANAARDAVVARAKAQTMTAILFDFATHADYRAAVRKEFDGLKALLGEYQTALKKTYTVPAVTDPK
jgi:hypothetical protein